MSLTFRTDELVFLAIVLLGIASITNAVFDWLSDERVDQRLDNNFKIINDRFDSIDEKFEQFCDGLDGIENIECYIGEKNLDD